MKLDLRDRQSYIVGGRGEAVAEKRSTNDTSKSTVVRLMRCCVGP
jgi:hypothetical protein